MDNATIAAISTPSGRGGIGIIKISGDNALSIAKTIFCRNIQEPISFPKELKIKSHQFYHGFIVEYDKKQVIDEVLFVYMKAPATYTMEDVVEIQAHSNSIILRKILKLIIDKGARLAEPGEFTKRAFLNGRIDLTQAESIIDIINAENKNAHKIAASSITGGLRTKIKQIMEKLKNVATEIEAIIDFNDEQERVLDVEITKKHILNNILRPIESLIKNHENFHYLREGINIIIIGKPNVGKSTLMNTLVKKERSIVTPFPGTTRDIVDGNICIDGIYFKISDSAGIHDSVDPVESIGIQRTIEGIEQSDIILFMVDGTSEIDNADRDIFKRIKQKRIIIVINKKDLINNDNEIKLPEQWKNYPSIKISARYAKGISTLKELVLRIIATGDINIKDTIIPNIRQKQCLEMCKNKILKALENLASGLPLEIISIDIKDSIAVIGKVIGETERIDIIDSVFRRFCVGK